MPNALESIQEQPWFKDGQPEDAAAKPERGIVNSPEAAPAPSESFLATNHWTGVVGTRVVTVYAGSAGWDEPGTGAVWVLDDNTEVTGSATGQVLRFEGTGALRVTAVEGDNVQVEGANGFNKWLFLGAILPR